MSRPPTPVAPDALDQQRINRLTLMPLHRLSLRLGEIDDLFADPENSEPGLMARLQVLGLFYFPLHHAAAKQALPVCWEWVKKEIFKVSGDDEGYAFLKAGLKERVVGPATVPFRNQEDSKTAGLPPSDGFAKIRLPGGYSFMTGGGQDGHFDRKYNLDSKAEMWDVEEQYRADNPVLGEIPIVAKVERWNVRDSKWEPAFDVAVHFEAAVPDATLPAEYDRPALRLGYAEGVLAAEKAREAGGPLFATRIVRGFNEAHPSRPLPHKPYPVAGLSPDRPGSVVARTNDDGEAGVVFLAPRLGGDRFKLCASILSGDGAVGVETGVLVVWRNIRISRYLRKEPAKTVLPDLAKEAQAYGIQSSEAYLDATGLGAGLPELDAAKLRKTFAEAYCEIEFDGDPTPIGEDDYAAAYDRIKKDSKECLLLRIPTLDFDKLLYPLDVAIHAGSVVLLPMRAPESYNACFPDATDKRRFRTLDGEIHPSDLGFMDAWKTSTMAPSFLCALSKNGFLPGLTIVQGALGCSWEILGLMGKETGAAYAHRGLLVWKGKRYYEKRDFTKIVAHEIGHCLFREHAPGREPIPGKPGQISPEAGGANAEEHDADNVCLMSYRPSRESFCAKCLLAMRGWRIRESSGVGGPGELRIRLAIDPAEASSFDDRFVLEGDDGYRETRTVKDDQIPGDRYVDLRYEGLDKSMRYTFKVRRSEEGSVETLFENVPYSDLANLSPGAEP